MPSTPPHNNDSDSNNPGQQFSREELLANWMNTRIQLANAIRRTQQQQQQQQQPDDDISLPEAAAAVLPVNLQGVPRQVFPVQGLPIHGMASTAVHDNDLRDQIHLQRQDIHASQVNAAVHNSITPQPLDIWQQSFAAQEQARQTVTIHHALAHPHAQAPTALQDAIPEINETLIDRATEKRADSLGGSLQETLEMTLKNKITRKIQEKLKELMPEINAHLLQEQEQEQEQEPYMPQQQMGLEIQHHERTGVAMNVQKDGARINHDVPISELHDGSVMRCASNNKLFLRIDDKEEWGIDQPMDAAKTMNKRQQKSVDKEDEAMSVKRELVGDGKSVSVSRESAPAGIIDIFDDCDEAPANDKPLNKSVVAAKEKQVSSKLDQIINSLEDTNMKIVVLEDRENNRAKRTVMQHIHENQIKEIESRLRMYTKLEDLAKQMADARTEGLAKKARTISPNVEGALDMIHSFKNYRLLEDTHDTVALSEEDPS